MYVLYVGLTNLKYKLRLRFVVFFYFQSTVSSLQNPHFYGIIVLIERQEKGLDLLVNAKFRYVQNCMGSGL